MDYDLLSDPKPVILLIEDDSDVRQLMVRILDGFALTEEADNGASALQVLARLKAAPSAIVTDIDMPVMNGLEFARIYRRNNSRVPILFITGTDPALVSETGFAGEVLRKPFGIETFLDRVMRLVSAMSG